MGSLPDWPGSAPVGWLLAWTSLTNTERAQAGLLPISRSPQTDYQRVDDSVEDSDGFVNGSDAVEDSVQHGAYKGFRDRLDVGVCSDFPARCGRSESV